MENSHFIKLLEYGEKVALDGVNFETVTDWAIQEEIIPGRGETSHDDARNFLRDQFFECFENSSGSTKNIWSLKTEYYFRLIEFRELQESRIASKQANRNSFIAIGISIFALVCTVLVSYMQLTGSVKISPAQIKEVVNSNNLPVSGAVAIDSKQLQVLVDAIKSSNKAVERGAQKTARPSP
ncbi:hypothetical protein MNBD_GAMMA06-1294 [hydrothermal vent metagenome]|uniref:Uncharacterized protein n=1 Tax=hydrothermal vent metagenome TaxID=652676 RepID=A0A3B0WEE7_9ZZZZ